MIKSYAYTLKAGTTGIQCRICNMTSWNPNDVSERYCGNCGKYHELIGREMVYAMLQAMRKYGGSFVRILADLYEAADPYNKLKLEDTFNGYFEEYWEMHLREKS